MQEVLSKYKKAILPVLALVAALATVRYYEHLFYDPFRNYFARDFFDIALPGYNGLRLFANFLFRYCINTIISLVVLYVIFRSRSQLKFAGVLYGIFFIFLVAVFFAVAEFLPQQKMLLFYIRRFLIQPMFLLLFIPAFIYQNHSRQ